LSLGRERNNLKLGKGSTKGAGIYAAFSSEKQKHLRYIYEYINSWHSQQHVQIYELEISYKIKTKY
jgi:hypothetical protein